MMMREEQPRERCNLIEKYLLLSRERLNAKQRKNNCKKEKLKNKYG